MAKQNQEFHGYDKFDTSFLKRPRNYNVEELGLQMMMLCHLFRTVKISCFVGNMGYDKLTLPSAERDCSYICFGLCSGSDEVEVKWLIERYHKFKDFGTKKNQTLGLFQRCNVWQSIIYVYVCQKLLNALLDIGNWRCVW